MFCPSIWLEHKSRQILFQYSGLLTIRIVYCNFPFFQTSKRPVAYCKLCLPRCSENWLATRSWFDLTSRSLQLFQELTSAFYKYRDKINLYTYCKLQRKKYCFRTSLVIKTKYYSIDSSSKDNPTYNDIFHWHLAQGGQINHLVHFQDLKKITKQSIKPS